MADSKISALPASTTPLAGTEVLPIVQSSATVKVSVANLTAGRAISATELTLTTGNLIVANGQGIDFSATSGAGTSELLADYEEGTWTPTLGGTTTYTSQTGLYTKIGRQVTLQGVLTINVLNTPTSSAQIRGLPFTANSTAGFYQSGSVGWWDSSNTPATWIGCFVNTGSTTIDITATLVAQASANDPFSVFKSGTTLFFSLTYFV